MVKLNRIYTKTGDGGTSGLGDGSRRPKTDVRFAAIGAVDEANCAIGVAASQIEGDYAQGLMPAMLARIQNDLFDLGADLSVPGTEGGLRIAAEQTQRLEQELDDMTAWLLPLTSFILPGGSKLAAALHLARAITRRAEREMLLLAAVEELNPHALRYINRLSDHLFCMARHGNDSGKDDVLWLPGENR